jgi:hypothetical protein
MPIIPVSINGHKLWVFVDSGATFSMLTVDEAERIGIDWQSGRRQMIVVGDGSYIPTFFHDLRLQIGASQITAPIGFSERLGVGFNLLGRTGVCSTTSKFASTITRGGLPSKRSHPARSDQNSITLSSQSKVFFSPSPLTIYA